MRVGCGTIKEIGDDELVMLVVVLISCFYISLRVRGPCFGSPGNGQRELAHNSLNDAQPLIYFPDALEVLLVILKE